MTMLQILKSFLSGSVANAERWFRLRPYPYNEGYLAALRDIERVVAQAREDKRDA